MPKKSKISEKQKRFCEEYLIDLNATQAAIRAGYSEKNASRIAIDLLNKIHVSEYLGHMREEQSKRTGITADKVLEEISRIAFTEDVEVSGKEKMHALEMLAKHLGVFDQKPTQIEIKDDPLSETLKEIAKGLKNADQ